MKNQALLKAFYTVVIFVSLIGASEGAAHWLDWILPAAILAVGALEMGGVVFAKHAAKRRALGEAATGARIVSALIACAAVAAQIIGHADSPPQAGFFAVMSMLGYVTYLFTSEAQRRDKLRAAGLLAGIPPRFGLFQWVREPRITRRARVLVQERAALRLDALQRRQAGELVAMPARLDALAALAAARREARTAKRHAAITTVLRRTITATVDKATADIAVAVYDLDEIAARLTARADYDALTDLVGAGLTPARLLGTAPAPAAPATVDQVDALDANPADALDASALTEHLFATHGSPLVIDDGARKIETASTTSDPIVIDAPADPATVEPAALLPLAPVDVTTVPDWATVPAATDPARLTAPVLFVAPPAPVDPVTVDQVGTDPAPVDQVDKADADPAPADQVDTDPAPTGPADDSEELRARARDEWRTTVESGIPLSGAELGRRYGLSPRWGQHRVREVRGTLATPQLPGQLALTDVSAPADDATAADRRELVGAGK